MFVRSRFNKNSKNIDFNSTQQTQNGDLNELENHFKNILSKWETTNKN